MNLPPELTARIEDLAYREATGTVSYPWLVRVLTELAEPLHKEIESLKSVECCEHCGSTRIYHGPPDCPMCGAPNCCQTCCEVAGLEQEVHRLKAQLAEAKRRIAILETPPVKGDEWDEIDRKLQDS